MLNNYQILSELFLNIQNSKSKFYQSKSSKDFEDVMQRLLDSLNFVKLSNDKEYKLQHIYNKELMFDEKITYEQVEQKWKTLKVQVLSKNNIELIQNPFKTLKNHFIIHPFGTQQFPDILIFCNDYVFCLEIKSISNLNKSSLPVWNSNLPKASSFYVYIQTNNNITFFKGEDFLGNSTRSYLNSFFDLIDEKQMLNDLKKKLSQHHLLSQSSENIFGLVPKIRKSFNYSLSFATNRNIGIFDNNLNKNWEDKLITFLRTFNE